MDRQAQRHDLGRDPAEIADTDRDRDQHFNRAAEPVAIEVANREQFHPVEPGGKEQTDKNQT